MALRVTKQWRSMLATTAQIKRRGFATAVSHGHEIPAKSKFSADSMPIMMLGGFTMMAVILAGHSTWQQLAYSPSVQVKKKKREMVPEVYEPDDVLGSADKFYRKSFLRKVGNIQERKIVHADPISPADPISKSRGAETLKSVGVRP